MMVDSYRAWGYDSRVLMMRRILLEVHPVTSFYQFVFPEAPLATSMSLAGVQLVASGAAASCRGWQYQTAQELGASAG